MTYFLLKIKISWKKFTTKLIDHFFSSSDYLDKEKLPEVNKDILNLRLSPRDSYVEMEFSSKNILFGKGYPNRGLDETNYFDVIEDFNKRAKGVYRINPVLFLESKIISSEVFYDFPKSLFSSSSTDIINALSFSSLKYKQEWIYGGETFLSRSGGFSLSVYDKEKECLKKYLGKKHKNLNLNVEDTMRVEIFGKNDSKARGLAKKHFRDKNLKDLISLNNQYSIICDYINELDFPLVYS